MGQYKPRGGVEVKRSRLQQDFLNCPGFREADTLFTSFTPSLNQLLFQVGPNGPPLKEGLGKNRKKKKNNHCVYVHVCACVCVCVWQVPSQREVAVLALHPFQVDH